MLSIAADCKLGHNALKVIPQGGVGANVDRKQRETEIDLSLLHIF
jgi:hypothetical protein